MAREISLLIPEFRSKVQEVIKACAVRGATIEVYYTLVTPLEQGRLWRQGRSQSDAELKVLSLEAAGAKYLAHCLRIAKAQETNLVTDAAPGCSWHQWGEAANVVWIDDVNKLNWNPFYKTEDEKNKNGYAILGEEAKRLGIVHGTTFDDKISGWNALQLRPEKSPVDVFSLPTIDAEMQKRFNR